MTKNKLFLINICGVLIAIINFYLIFSPSLKTIATPIEVIQLKENLTVIASAMENYYNEHQNYPDSSKVNNLDDLLNFLSPFLDRTTLISFTLLYYSNNDHNYSIKTKINNYELELTPQGIKEKIN